MNQSILPSAAACLFGGDRRILPPVAVQLCAKNGKGQNGTMRVLIVGCGYVGMAVGEMLANAGHHVFGMRRSAGGGDDLKAVGIEPVVGDVTQPRRLADLKEAYDWVVNCVGASGGGVEEYRRIYLEGTQNLIEWLSLKPPQKFVYTSSTSVYGQNDSSAVTESSPAEPLAETAKLLTRSVHFVEKATNTAWNTMTMPVISQAFWAVPW